MLPFITFILLLLVQLSNGETKSKCDQPKVVGPCKANFSRWWFNSETKKCEYFRYGGCKGNENNFESDGECQMACRGGMEGRISQGDPQSTATDASTNSGIRFQFSIETGFFPVTVFILHSLIPFFTI